MIEFILAQQERFKMAPMMDEIVKYHVYADNTDLFTEDFVEAVKEFNKLVDEGEPGVRMGREVYADEEAVDNDEYVENTIMSHGGFPF